MAAKRVARYLHLPVQFLWFEMDDIVIMVLGYLVWMMASSWYAVPVVIGMPWLFMEIKAKNPRGFLKHLLVEYGFASLKGYPPAACERYDE